MPQPYAIADPRAYADYLSNVASQPVVIGPHEGTVGTLPTVAAGAQVTTATMVAGSTDFAGKVSILTTGAAAAGVQATVTFATAFTVAPVVILTYDSAVATQTQLRATVTTTTFTIDTLTALGNTLTYLVGYIVVGQPA